MQKEDMPLEGFGGWVRARARGKVGAVSEEAKIGVFRIRRVWVSWFSGVFFGGRLCAFRSSICRAKLSRKQSGEFGACRVPPPRLVEIGHGGGRKKRISDS